MEDVHPLPCSVLSTFRLALWHAFQQHTRGTKPLPVRPKHRPALREREKERERESAREGEREGGKTLAIYKD